MFFKIRKKLQNHLWHPLYWNFTLILSLIVIQFLLGVILCLGYICFVNSTNTKYSDFILNERRKSIQNIKLAGVEPYIWKPYLHCRTLLEPFNNFQSKPQKLGLDCIPTAIKFLSIRSMPTLNTYILNEKQDHIIYNEIIPSPCLSCHENNNNLLVQTSFTIENTSQAFTLFYSNKKILILFIEIYLGVMCFVWGFYSMIRLIWKYIGWLDVAIITIRWSNQNTKILKSLSLKKRYFLQLDYLDDSYIGVMPIKTLSYYMMGSLQNKEAYKSLALSIIVSKTPVLFDTMKLGHFICTKIGWNQIVLDKRIPDLFKKINFPIDYNQSQIFQTSNSEIKIYYIKL